MIRHMAYVACDGCGKPASIVCDDGTEARRMVPADWVRTSAYGPRRDLCPKCAYDDTEASR